VYASAQPRLRQSAKKKSKDVARGIDKIPLTLHARVSGILLEALAAWSLSKGIKEK
jgi:hypothetical protein